MPAPGIGPHRRGNSAASAPSGTQNVNVQNFPATQPVSGTVNVGNLPATQPVSGTVAVSNFPTTQPVSGNVSVGNFPANQTVSGSVSVSNFPATQQVSDAGGSLTVDSPQIPASLGAKAGTASLSVVPATDGLFTTVERGSGSIATGQVAVNNTTAVQIVPARAGRRKVTIAPVGTYNYFIGASGVTAATGFSVLGGGAVTLDTTAAVFAITGSAAANGAMTFVETF